MSGGGERQKRGIGASNSHFSSYEGVKKPKYNLTEVEAVDHYEADDRAIARVDVSCLLDVAANAGEVAQCSSRLADALKTIGFVVLKGHGFDPALHASAHDRVAALFTTLGAEEKRAFNAQRKGSVKQVYFGIAETSGLHPDQVEGWVFCRRAFVSMPPPSSSPSSTAAAAPAATAFWPGEAERAAREERFWREHVERHLTLVQPLARAILTGLKADLDHPRIRKLLDSDLVGNNFGLRLNYYPPMTAEAEAQRCGRMLGHEDVDLFTLLPASPVEGLQVLNRSTGRWIRLQAELGDVILNTGDYFQRLTNDLLPSTTHRVAPPRDSQLRRTRCRTSFPLALYLDEEVLLDTLPTIPGCSDVDCPYASGVTAMEFHTGITSKYYGDSYKQTGSD